MDEHLEYLKKQQSFYYNAGMLIGESLYKGNLSLVVTEVRDYLKKKVSEYESQIKSISKEDLKVEAGDHGKEFA